ncbi:MAG: hypothetical protein ACYS15_18970 [Planctomycetota bacterium]
MIAEAIERETTACPLCASRGQRVTFRFSSFRVVRCTACAFHYLSVAAADGVGAYCAT